MKPERFILFTIFILSSIALAIDIASIATNEWITSTAKRLNAAKPSIINYGLFSGFLENYSIATPFKYDLTVTCNYEEGKCIYSCHKTAEKRQNELLRIIRRETLEPCTPNTERSFFNFHLKYGNIKGKAENEENTPKPADNEINLIGSGYWVCTVMFLIIEIIFATAACIFSIINYYWNPIEPIFNVFGLFIWNTIAATSRLLTMIIWGALFDTTLKYNVAITDTLRPENPYSSNGLATLGYSYFILLIGVLFNYINVGLLIWRNLVLSRIPPPVVIDKGDDTVLAFY